MYFYEAINPSTVTLCSQRSFKPQSVLAFKVQTTSCITLQYWQGCCWLTVSLVLWSMSMDDSSLDFISIQNQKRIFSAIQIFEKVVYYTSSYIHESISSRHCLCEIWGLGFIWRYFCGQSSPTSRTALLLEVPTIRPLVLPLSWYQRR
jgi:FlaA1/EpsC-like NDP-sugar epimerase